MLKYRNGLFLIFPNQIGLIFNFLSLFLFRNSGYALRKVISTLLLRFMFLTFQKLANFHFKRTAEMIWRAFWLIFIVKQTDMNLQFVEETSDSVQFRDLLL